ncbi:hypothetical protein N7478_008725 [Penicillium angulare]|uniref:uncharacterized protein n=1 Tax=Penicillium angulare TaxID=116970 RepID=UPI0025402F43|nr:uncharacterized protein N7478_008725 [Penicillium angulare]KAJ5273600.1 hypothetical protein N7478_008725 [Penicillium angulare]
MRPATILLVLAPAMVSAEWAFAWWGNENCDDSNRLGYIGEKPDDQSYAGTLDSGVLSARFTFTDTSKVPRFAHGAGDPYPSGDGAVSGHCYTLDPSAENYWAYDMDITTTFPNR